MEIKVNDAEVIITHAYYSVQDRLRQGEGLSEDFYNKETAFLVKHVSSWGYEATKELVVATGRFVCNVFNRSS
jgi:hypothetical protein